MVVYQKSATKLPNKIASKSLVKYFFNIELHCALPDNADNLLCRLEISPPVSLGDPPTVLVVELFLLFLLCDELLLFFTSALELLWLFLFFFLFTLVLWLLNTLLLHLLALLTLLLHFNASAALLLHLDISAALLLQLVTSLLLHFDSSSTFLPFLFLFFSVFVLVRLFFLFLVSLLQTKNRQIEKKAGLHLRN